VQAVVLCQHRAGVRLGASRGGIQFHNNIDVFCASGVSTAGGKNSFILSDDAHGYSLTNKPYPLTPPITPPINSTHYSTH
jgi:hypothetical protein